MKGVRKSTEDSELLTKNDWDYLLLSAKQVTYEKNQPIVLEGEQFQRIYQIVSGTCRIEKKIDKVDKVLGAMVAGSTFGGARFFKKN